MSLQVGWVKRPHNTKGLDPLGVQAPCISIYGQLLPGITNVTDRARYFSFYPWVLWTFDRLPGEKSRGRLIDWIRSADCLFTLIGNRHAAATKGEASQHDAALVGSLTLRPVAAALERGDHVHLSRYTKRGEENSDRYFKNPLGGLGQYYMGSLADSGLVTIEGGVPRYTTERGKPLAEAFDATVPGDLFVQTTREDEVTPARLDKLAAFCPCALHDAAKEKGLLLDLFFDRKSTHGPAGVLRRRSLGLILDLLLKQKPLKTDSEEPFNHHAFRNAVYSGFLDSSAAWSAPASLESAREGWSTYQRNELLSAALQCTFDVALRALDAERPAVFSVEEFTRWFADRSCVAEAAGALGSDSLPHFLETTRRNLPPLSATDAPHHEMALVQTLFTTGNQPPDWAPTLTAAARIVATLVVRDNASQSPYLRLVFPPDYLALYPINLASLRRLAAETWPKMDLRTWLAWLAGHWAIESHLRVALRKLRQQSFDTFHVLPTDRGLRVENFPIPTYTSPRFNQTLQILQDLGAVRPSKSGDSFTVTKLGEELWHHAAS